MGQRRKRRTSIRTAAGTTQEKFLQRVRAVRDDPTCVLPECVGDEPRPVARIRKRLEAFAAGKKPGLLDRRDKGVVGAVAHTIPLADLESVPRLVDQRVSGRRRFFLQRGHVERMCSLGVQNHDDPETLLMAWRPLAKQGLHFFAGPRLWCTGEAAAPPAAWVEALGRPELGFAAEQDDSSWGCGHPERPRILLRFDGGASIAICRACAKRTGNLHSRLARRYAGPRQRRPVQVRFLAPDGRDLELDDDSVAAYRADVKDEATLVAEGMELLQAGAGDHFVLGAEDFGTDQKRFLDRLAPADWERSALKIATAGGHAGSDASIEAVLQAHRPRLLDAWQALTGLPPEAPPTTNVRDWLRRGVEAGARRRASEALPEPKDVGPVGRFLDRVARAHHAQGPKVAAQVARDALTDRNVPSWHVGATLLALGADLPYSAADDEREAAMEWRVSIEAVLAGEGQAYLDALRDHLQRSGTGEA